MAWVYLRRKIQDGIFDPYGFGVASEDVALHAILPLLERDKSGQFINVAPRYLEFIRSTSSDNYLHPMRQLTFSAVEEELSPYYAENPSPTFDSFQRELCAAVNEYPEIAVEEKSGCRWIVIHESRKPSGEYTTQSYAPVIPLEFLQIRLTSTLSANRPVDHALRRWREIVTDHTDYRSAVPLPLLAKALERMCSPTQASYAGAGRERQEWTAVNRGLDNRGDLG